MIVPMMVLVPNTTRRDSDIENLTSLKTPTLAQVRSYGGQPYRIDDFVKVFNDGTLHLDHYTVLTCNVILPDGPSADITLNEIDECAITVSQWIRAYIIERSVSSDKQLDVFVTEAYRVIRADLIERTGIAT